MKEILKLVGIACMVLALAGSSLAGTPEKKTEVEVNYNVIRVPVSTEQVWVLRRGDGGEIYTEFCAECHGATGVGNPVAAVALGEPIPNLTKLSDRDRPGEFARAYVDHVLSAKCDDHHHKSVTGARTMPCWRNIVAHSLNSDAASSVVMASLANHLESLQE